jgi:hypothetical protein
MNIAITNNPMVRDSLPERKIMFLDTGYLGVLEAVRDKIHLGHKLLTHPLSGSVKPGETPYKTVLISAGKGLLDEESLSIIENSIQTCRKFTAKSEKQSWNLPPRILADFQLIDFNLIFSDSQRTGKLH